MYYLMARFSGQPSFSACNDNEVIMTGKKNASIDLCQNGAVGSGAKTMYVGLYGGESCAIYTITPSVIDAAETCSSSISSICNNPSHYRSASAGRLSLSGLPWRLGLLLLACAVIPGLR